ncbi:MAG: hypothetical protein ACRENL_04010 [Candidatus Dormibacteria bacterium]
MTRPWMAPAAAGVALLALAAVRGAGGGPPLYDGICLPPQYTMLGASPGPTTASHTFSADDLASSQPLSTGESTPQAQMIFAGGSLAPPPGSSSVTVTITPVRPPAVKPADGTIDGNVYDFEARSAGRSVPLAAGHPATIVLAATSSGGPQLVVEHFDGSRWAALGKTFQSGCGTTYEAASPTLGLFVLVAQGAGGGHPGGSQGGGVPVVLIVVVVVVALLAVVIGSARLGRRGGRRR